MNPFEIQQTVSLSAQVSAAIFQANTSSPECSVPLDICDPTNSDQDIMMNKLNDDNDIHAPAASNTPESDKPWPEWFMEDHGYLIKTSKDEDWNELIMAWVAFEIEMDFPVGTVSSNFIIVPGRPTYPTS